jgi:hypothetical protein
VLLAEPFDDLFRAILGIIIDDDEFDPDSAWS